MNTIICLGGGVEAVPIIQRVREMGHRAVVVDGDPNAPGFAVANRFVVTSCYHAQGAIEDLKNTSEHYDGVLCCAVDAPVVAAEIRQAFGLPGLGVEAARLSVNKYEQIRTLSRHDIPTPNFWGPGRDFSQYMPAIEQNVVVKPTDLRGARGVERIDTGTDAGRAALRHATSSSPGRAIVEEWLDGPQLSTESIVAGGRVLFTAVALRNYARLDEFAPYVIEDGFDEPFDQSSLWGAHIPGRDWQSFKLNELIENSCRALGWDNLTVKGDIVIHNGKLYIIELAARLSGGFLSTHGHRNAYGFDFVGAAIDLSFGQKFDIIYPTYHKAFVSQRYVFPAPGDIGKKVVSVKPLSWSTKPFHELLEDYPFRTYNIRVGDVIRPVTCHPARWGQALAVAQTRAEAEHVASDAVLKMKAGVVLE